MRAQLRLLELTFLIQKQKKTKVEKFLNDMKL